MTWADIPSLHSDYLSRKVTVEEVVSSYLDVIDRQNPRLNAFLTVDADSALNTARQLDSLLQKDPSLINSRPLFGVPIGLKDVYVTKGLKTTAGAKLLQDYVPPYDATVVAKYKSAGAVILGKLNCDAWAHGSSGENSDFGPSRNPWNTDYVPGGSSSGSAVAVSAGMCLVSGGTDTGGSIRCPASFCSVVGLKPTYGRVSRYGIIAMASSLDSIGHFTRTAADSERVLAVTAGIDPLDATSSPEKFSPSPSLSSLANLTVGVPQEYQATDAEVSQKVSELVSWLAAAGAKILDVSLPSTSQALAAYYIIQPAEVSSNLARFDGIRYGRGREAFSAEAQRRIMLGTFTLSSGYYEAYYKKGLAAQRQIAAEFAKVFSKVDLLVTPVMPHLPFKIGEKTTDPLALYLEDALTVPVNLAGLPAISVPCGFSKSKLPIGAQFIGPKWSEALLFSVTKFYQSHTRHHHERPPGF